MKAGKIIVSGYRQFNYKHHVPIEKQFYNQYLSHEENTEVFIF